MRICVIGYEASESSGWGIARYTWQLIRYLKTIPGMEVIFTGCGMPSRNLLKRNLEKLIFYCKILGLKGTLYHAITPILALPLAIVDKSPSIVTVHDLLHFYEGYGSKRKLPIDFTYHAYVFDKVDAIITTAKYWKHDIIRMFEVNSDKIHVIYNGVDPKKYRPMKGIRRSALKKRVLYVGSPTSVRGLEILIQAFSIASKEYKNIEFLIGGKTDMEYISKLANKYKVKIHTLGFVPEDELPRLYNSVHLFVNPPTDEFSLMLLEAMACGTPVIARRIFEMSEYLGDAALLVNSEEPYELAGAIVKLLTDEELWFKLSKKGLERSKSFTWDKTAENTYKIYAKYWGDSLGQNKICNSRSQRLRL